MSEDLKDVLGLEREVKSFLDEKVRVAYPITMKEFPAFIEKFSYINIDKFWGNFVFDEGSDALRHVLEVTFKDDELDDIVENINAKNYKEIIELVMAINGLDFNKEGEESKNEKGV